MADLLTVLATQVATKTSLTLATNLFTAPEVPPGEDVPPDSVFIWESDGFAMPIPEMKPVSSTTKRTFCQSHLHVKVRRQIKKYTEGRVLFDQIIAALDGYKAAGADDIYSFEWCKATKPKPMFKGPNDQGLYIWELVFELGYYRLITANAP